MTAAPAEIQRYSDDLQPVWDDFLATTKNRSFLFRRDYMDYHRDRFHDHSLLLRIKGRLVACLPAHVAGDELCSHQGLTFGGLLMHRDFRLEHARLIVEALRDYMRAQGLAGLDYRPMPHPYHDIPAEEDLVALLTAGAALTDARAVAFARSGRNRKVSRDRLRDLRRGSMRDVAIRRSADIRGFIRICAAHRKRRFSSGIVHNEDEMALLAGRFPDNIHLYVLERAGEVLAGAVVYHHGICAKIQYGAPATGEKGLMSWLYGHLLRDILPEGTWVDFGHSCDFSGQFRPGILQYKESLGARTVLMARYRLPAR